jgi:hypothetical protein
LNFNTTDIFLENLNKDLTIELRKRDNITISQSRARILCGEESEGAETVGTKPSNTHMSAKIIANKGDGKEEGNRS